MKKSILVIILMTSVNAVNALDCRYPEQSLRFCFEWAASLIDINAKHFGGDPDVGVYRDPKWIMAADYIDSQCSYNGGVNNKQLHSDLAATTIYTDFIAGNSKSIEAIKGSCFSLMNHHINDLSSFVKNN